MIKNNYTEIIDLYIKKLEQELKENLKLIYIIGSSATEDVIVNWSDIDCIIVLNDYAKRDIEIIKEISNSFSVKVGNTIYSRKEFEKGIIDPKTYYYLLLQKNNVLNFQYKSDDLLIPNVNLDECKRITKIILTMDLHNCKRLLTYKEINNNQIKTLFKKIYVIMKSLLIINNYTPKNYKETFGLFCEIFKFEYFDYLVFINDFKNDKVDPNKLKDYALNLIVYITNNLL